ncbi:MAG TPA: ribonuclease E/G, partial [Candidatus Limiplasma sp.]|nr:ribonuclease E/G [Candidatus Limiplasma sp.]
RLLKRQQSGELFLGRVERVVPGMQAAFVQIGQPLNGFLPLTEMDSFTRQSGDTAVLAAGADVMVQVKKDAKDQKGAFLSRDISLPGQYLILMPLNRYVGVSKRVTDGAERETLLALGQELCGGAFGLIMRSTALSARREALLEELTDLQALWKRLQDKAVYAKAPAVLHRDISVLSALVRDYAPRYSLGITCNDAVNRMPAPPNGLLWEQVSDAELDAAWASSRVEAQLTEALGRRVELKNGGSLVIDEREALSTVDVNSGHFIGSGEADTAVKHNVAACAEIARQIRLRNLSGIVLIDFIDMASDAHRAQVIDRLSDELSRERDKTVIHGFTSLGLLELTRKRTGASLRDALETPCDRCNGTGYRMERDLQV